MLSDVKAKSAQSAKSSASASSLVEAKAAAALASTTSPGVDRRRSARKTSNLPAWLSDQSGGRRPQQQRVIVTDMSMHGVGFIASEKVEIGATHWIVVAAEQLHLSTRLKIVFSRPRPDGTYDVGAEFF